MKKSALSTIWLFAALLAVSGCSQTIPASECDGWKRLTPAQQTRAFIIDQDRGFAEQVASHNLHGKNRSCW